MLRILKYPLAFFFLVTSFPAGFVPFVLLGAVLEDLPPDAPDPWPMYGTMAGTAAVTLLAHVLVSLFLLPRWNRKIIDTRGAVWFVIAQTSFALGVGFGVWVLLFLAP